MKLHQIEAALGALDKGNVALVTVNPRSQFGLRQARLGSCGLDDLNDRAVASRKDRFRHRARRFEGPRELNATFPYDDFPYTRQRCDAGMFAELGKLKEQMRGLIKTSASIFILLGAMTFGVAGLAALKGFSEGAASDSATFPAMISFIVALSGLLGGASLVLVGGTAYLLSSIDERIERAISKTSRQAPAADFMAAE